jgi:hypothetical protein
MEWHSVMDELERIKQLAGVDKITQDESIGQGPIPTQTQHQARYRRVV